MVYVLLKRGIISWCTFSLVRCKDMKTRSRVASSVESERHVLYVFGSSDPCLESWYKSLLFRCYVVNFVAAVCLRSKFTLQRVSNCNGAEPGMVKEEHIQGHQHSQ